MSEGELVRDTKAPDSTKLASSDGRDAGNNWTHGGEPSSKTDSSPGTRRPGFMQQLRDLAREHRAVSSLAAILLLLLLAGAVAGAGLAFWAVRDERRALKMRQQAVEKSQKAQETAEEYKGKFHQMEAAWKAAIDSLRLAQAATAEAQRSEKETKAVLDFFKKNLLSAGRPGDGSLPAAFWAAGKSRDVTLLKAVDSAEPQVAVAYAEHPETEAVVREMLGSAYLNVGEAARAVRQYERALALREATYGANHPETAACLNQLAVAYRLAGRADDASRLFERNPNSPAHAAALAISGSMLLLKKQPNEAELKLRQSLTIRQKIQPDDWVTFDTKSSLGEALLDQKKFDDAEPLLLSGYQGMKQREDKIPSGDRARLNRALERLVKLYEAWGKKDEATKWRKEHAPSG